MALQVVCLATARVEKQLEELTMVQEEKADLQAQVKKANNDKAALLFEKATLDTTLSQVLDC